MLPTYEQYKTGGTTWRREHRGVGITLSHHGVSEYQPDGIWCYYLHLDERMFQNPADFALFDREPEIVPSLGTEKVRERYAYETIPDLEFHGEVTFYERHFVLDRFTSNMVKVLKIGCDYAHLFDREQGYWQGIGDVERDAQRSASVLVDTYPQNERCGYSGRIAHPSEFYTAKNGSRIHQRYADTFDDGWHMWRPASVDGRRMAETEGLGSEGPTSAVPEGQTPNTPNLKGHP